MSTSIRMRNWQTLLVNFFFMFFFCFVFGVLAVIFTGESSVLLVCECACVCASVCVCVCVCVHGLL